MKGFLTLAALLLCFTLLQAQPIQIGVPTLSAAKSFETEGFASLPRQVMFDQTNAVITAGTLETKTDFDPSPTTTAFLQPAAGEGKNSFVSKLNEDGTYAWAYQFGGGYDETVIGMDIDSDNNLYVMGTFYGTVDFDPDPVDTDVRVSTELFGLYLVSFTPAGDFRWVELMEDTKSNTVRIFNRWGDLVFEVNDYNNTTNVFRGFSNSGKELPSGTYFYTISFGSGKESVNGYLSLKR